MTPNEKGQPFEWLSFLYPIALGPSFTTIPVLNLVGAGSLRVHSWSGHQGGTRTHLNQIVIEVSVSLIHSFKAGSGTSIVIGDMIPFLPTLTLLADELLAFASGQHLNIIPCRIASFRFV